MQTILITGINGFLGSNLAKRLSTEYNILGFEHSISNLHRIRDFDFKVYESGNHIPHEAFTEQKIDIIIHTATCYGREREKPTSVANTNLSLPINLLERAIECRCTLFVNADTVLDRFTNVYSLSKRHFQEWLFYFQKEIKIVNLQLEHFYGPGAGVSNFISLMINRLVNNELEIQLTKGDQLRDFVYIDDVIEAFYTVINRVPFFESQCSSLQVCTGQHISIKELMLLLKKHTKSTSKLKFGVLPYRENEMMKSRSDNSKLIKYGWQPKHTIEQGIIKTIEATLNNKQKNL